MLTSEARFLNPKAIGAWGRSLLYGVWGAKPPRRRRFRGAFKGALRGGGGESNAKSTISQKLKIAKINLEI